MCVEFQMTLAPFCWAPSKLVWLCCCVLCVCRRLLLFMLCLQGIKGKQIKRHILVLHFWRPSPAAAIHITALTKKRLILDIPQAAEIPLCPCVKAWPLAETCSPTHPTFHGNSTPSQWTNAQAEPHTDSYTQTHPCSTEPEQRLCVSVHKFDRLLHTRTHTQGLPWPQCRQQRSVNWDLFCLPPRDNNVSVPSLSVFSLFPSFPFVHSPHALSVFHPTLPHRTSSPGWPSATFTPCLGWLSLSGWPWCLGHRRRTSSAVSSWGSSPCWWSRPPRTSWVSTCSHTCSVTERRNVTPL